MNKLRFALFLALAPSAFASTWYVNGATGSDQNDCKTSQTACKTIGHAISLASSGDTIKVSGATYTENLNISTSLKILGTDARNTIVHGGNSGGVFSISSAAHVTLSELTITGGSLTFLGGAGISNSGTLTILNCTVTGNTVSSSSGGGIFNSGTLAIFDTTVSGNVSARGEFSGGLGGGIYNSGLKLFISNSTITGNFADNGSSTSGGGIYNDRGQLQIGNSTISDNSASFGGGVFNNSSTGALIVQNSILANNLGGGNCSGSIISDGYNLSSDGSCNFSNSGDLQNTDPKLGPLQNNGGPTQTQSLQSGSPAIDAGNPSGCTDGNGHLLKTDQRGYPRPDKEDSGGCDMGAYEKQSD
jgi:hypothetical protein